MMKYLGRYGLVTATIIAATVIVVLQYVRAERTKEKLVYIQQALSEAEIELSQEKEVAAERGKRLIQALNEKESLEITLDKLKGELGEVKAILDETKAKLACSEEESATLVRKVIELEQIKESLAGQITEIRKEKEILEAKLNSIKELKKTIKALKRTTAYAKMEKQMEKDAEELIKGNRGYLWRDGYSTMKAKIEIKVLPAPLENRR